MVNIVTAGIGYGVKGDFGGYSVLEPKNLSEFRNELKSTGVIVRDVVGYVFFDKEQPHMLTMMIQKQEKKQLDSDSTIGDIANLWPAGGKVDPPYVALSDAGFITIEQAYAASGFVGEIDELGGPKKTVLDVLNRTQGLPHKNVLSSKDGKDLYVEGNFVRRFAKNPNGGIDQFMNNLLGSKHFGKYDSLTSINVSYAMGIDPNDTKNGRPVVTSVANLWIPASRKEIDVISGYVGNSTVDDIVSMDLIDLRTFGTQNPTTVSNMVATALLVSNPGVYMELTGVEMSSDMPGVSDIEGFNDAKTHTGKTIEQMVELAIDGIEQISLKL
jgi:hypothetical protein